MKTETIQKTFGKMKADFKVGTRTTSGYTVDVKKGTFLINASRDVIDNMEITVSDIDVKDRHVLINVKTFFPKRKGGGFDFTNDKWLCGHDERDWFVGAIPSSSVKNIIEAKRSLKPQAVLDAEKVVKGKKANARRNKARVRQGEWFFIPAPDLIVKPGLIHKNEPISRGRGSKPHMIEELYRTGGTTVYVSRNFPSGLEEKNYKAWIEKHPKEVKDFRIMTRDASVYGRGAVRHKDHATIYLDGWHQILMNTESQSRRMASLVFLD